MWTAGHYQTLKLEGEFKSQSCKSPLLLVFLPIIQNKPRTISQLHKPINQSYCCLLFPSTLRQHEQVCELIAQWCTELNIKKTKIYVKKAINMQFSPVEAEVAAHMG